MGLGYISFPALSRADVVMVQQGDRECPIYVDGAAGVLIHRLEAVKMPPWVTCRSV